MASGMENTPKRSTKRKRRFTRSKKSKKHTDRKGSADKGKSSSLSYAVLNSTDNDSYEQMTNPTAVLEISASDDDDTNDQKTSVVPDISIAPSSSSCNNDPSTIGDETRPSYATVNSRSRPPSSIKRHSSCKPDDNPDDGYVNGVDVQQMQPPPFVDPNRKLSSIDTEVVEELLKEKEAEK